MEERIEKLKEALKFSPLECKDAIRKEIKSLEEHNDIKEKFEEALTNPYAFKRYVLDILKQNK